MKGKFYSIRVQLTPEELLVTHLMSDLPIIESSPEKTTDSVARPENGLNEC